MVGNHESLSDCDLDYSPPQLRPSQFVSERRDYFNPN